MRPPAAVRTQPQSETATEFVYALRIAAIAAIVLMNTATRGFTDVVIGSGGWQVLNIFNTLARWAVPVFVMIAGTLMLDPETPTGMRVLFKKHLLRLGVIYGFWSLVYALAAPGGVPQTVGALLEQTLKGPPHFWYIPMLAGLYLITPVLKPFVCRAGKRELEYFLLLCFVLGCGVGLLKGLALFSPLIEAADALKLPFVFGYTGFYVFGYYSRAYPPRSGRASHSGGCRARRGGADRVGNHRVVGTRRGDDHGTLREPDAAIRAHRRGRLHRRLCALDTPRQSKRAPGGAAHRGVRLRDLHSARVRLACV